MNFINNIEMAALVSEGFSKKEITTTSSNGITQTIIYCGKSRLRNPDDRRTETDPNWKIRKTWIVEDGTSTTIVETWAQGSWQDRENLDYLYL